MWSRTEWNRSFRSALATSTVFLSITLWPSPSARCQESQSGFSGTENASAARLHLPSRGVTVLPAQTVVGNFSLDQANNEAAWNRLVLLATPKINRGDTEAVNSSFREAATACSLTIMASLSKDQHENHSIKDIGVGYSIIHGSERIVISSESDDDASRSLSFIARQVLRTNEQQLMKLRLVAKSSVVAILDAPTIFYRKGGVKRYLTRHFFWINPATGAGKMVVWLMTPTTITSTASKKGEQRFGVISHPMRYLNWAAQETRNIHVDANEFSFLGIPGELAFALEDLPPGTDHAWTRQVADLAGSPRYSSAELQSLHQAIMSVLKSTVARETRDASGER